MPELPEVESQRRMLEDNVVGLRIRRVTSTEQGGGGRHGLFDDKVCGEGLTEETLGAALTGKWVVAARRKGKQMWLELGESRGGAPCASLLIHLGMTGALCVRGEAGPAYKRFDVDALSQWPPRFTKLELALAASDTAPEVALAYMDGRRFGKILLRPADATASPPISALAPDPLTDMPLLDAFAAKLKRSSTTIKAALLDQGRICCGIGNWIADEVLYQAAISPSAPCNLLDAAQVAALHGKIVDVCTFACAVSADHEQFPPTWLFHYRWANQTTGSIASPLGRVHFDTVGGRTTAFLPHVQKAAAGGKPPDTSKVRKRAAPKNDEEEVDEEDEPIAVLAKKPRAPKADKAAASAVKPRAPKAEPVGEAEPVDQAEPVKKAAARTAKPRAPKAEPVKPAVARAAKPRSLKAEPVEESQRAIEPPAPKAAAAKKAAGSRALLKTIVNPRAEGEAEIAGPTQKRARVAAATPADPASEPAPQIETRRSRRGAQTVPA
jgi:formamidopyrimidine-DNA glycosylase